MKLKLNLEHFDCSIFGLQLLADVEDHLDITIDQIEPNMKVPINEFDGKVTYGQKRANTGKSY